MQNKENARERACMSVQKIMFHHNNTPKLLCQMSDNGGFKRMSHPNRIKKEVCSCSTFEHSNTTNALHFPNV